MTKIKYIIIFFLTLAALPSVAHAGVSEETAYLFNTLLFLIGGVLVMWMAAGFTMLEAGLVRVKNVGDICLKNLLLYSLACIAFYGVGYNLMYDGVSGGFFGSLTTWGADDAAALAETPDLSAGYASSSDFFFQMVFVATTASIVSGTVAERIKLFPFLIFTAVLSAFIYPIQGSWQWGGGWLSELGFSDFAGSTLVHSVGGWAALTGAIILGPRMGRYDSNGRVRPMPGSNLPMATLGTFILWVGWFGFNGASQLAFGTVADGVTVANIFANTNMAASGGALSAALVARLIYKKIDLTMTMNGALAGLVSITAGPDTPSIGGAILIGAVGGALVVFTIPMLDRFKIDDVVGAISVHLFCGIWGTMAVPLSNPDASFTVQFIGVAAIGTMVVISSSMVRLLIKATVGLRLGEDEELIGSDVTELGLEAYPEFGHGSQKLGDY